MTAADGLILVAEDELQMLRFLRASLSGHGYRVLEATTGAQALSQAAEQRPDVVLLDLGLPDKDGIEVVRGLRQWTRTPVIVISARGREEDKIDALDAGADDYLTKPFSVGELLARVRVALRHGEESASGHQEAIFEASGVRVDLKARQVTVRGEEVHLTPTEYALLGILIRHAGRVVTHRQLLQEVRGPSHSDDTQYLRVYMGQLRRKLELDPARPNLLINEPGVGYRLKVA